MKGSYSLRKLTMKLVATIFRQKGGQVNCVSLEEVKKDVYVYYLTDACLCHYLFLLFANIPHISDIGVVCEFRVLARCY